MLRHKGSFSIMDMVSRTVDRVRGKDYNVSVPMGTIHLDHIDYNEIELDEGSATGFRGLPQKYERLLGVSGITKEDALAHKEEVLGALKFHIEGRCINI